MSRKFLTDIDLSKNELQNHVLHRLASAPSSPVEGQIYYNTGDDKIYYRNASTWVEIGAAGEPPTVDSDDVTNVSTVSGATVSDALETLDGDIDTANTAIGGLDTRLDTAEGEIDTAQSDITTLDGRVDTAETNITALQSGKADITYVDSLVQGLSWKDSVRVASTGNVALANGLENGDSIDGVTLATGDRVLLRAQSAPAENGIYVVVASGAASRATDVNSATEIKGATVLVEAGSTYADTVWTMTTDGAITLDTTSLAFAQVNGGAVPQATTSTQGKVELATTGETEAKTDTDRAVTPSGLATFTRKYAADIGDNSSTQIDVTHSLGTKDVTVSVRQVADDIEVYPEVKMHSTTVVRLTFSVAPASSALRVVVIG